MLGWNRNVMSAGVAILLGITGLSYVLKGPAAPPSPPSRRARTVEFTLDGKLKKPVGYRKWVYVGTPLTPNDLNDGEATFPEFHSVYMDPESFAHYEKTGEFRDGTVMVKELVRVGAKKATSGKGYFMGDFIGLEASIKDSKRFPDEPGSWAYFSFGHKLPLKAEVAKNAAASCNKCHEDSAKKDFVFSQYYPVLRASAPRHPARPDAPAARKADNFSPYVSKEGDISRPTNYRETFLHLGSFAVASKPKQPLDEMHNVYARPEDVRAYRRDGKFPDGAALVKEVTQVGSEKLTTGQSHWSTDVKIWFVMIKDAKGRFPGNELWGDGWGWALFEAKKPARNMATNYKTDCRLCHVPAKKDDWLYVRGYPVLGKRKTAH